MTTRNHIYHTADGLPHMRMKIVQHVPGKMRYTAFRRKDGDWKPGVRGLTRYLYNLPAVIERNSMGGVIIVVEGEKDADRATNLGYTATTNPFGPGHWHDGMSEYLSEATVIIIQDNDDAGKAHAQAVRASLLKAGACTVEILDLTTLEPKLGSGADLSDYLDHGGSAELLRLAIDRLSNIVRDDEATDRIVQPPTVVLDTLPVPLRDLLISTTDPYQRTALLAASLVTVGSILPNVRTLYHGKYYSPALYLFVVGPPGSGKGSLLPALLLVQPIHDELMRASREARKEYQRLVREHDASGPAPTPEEPTRQILIVPADSTGPVIVRSICENPAVLLFDTEADTIQTALRAETGSISSVLRKVWQHEPVSRARARDSEYVSTTTPHFSMVLTGTPDQVVALASQVANGLMSRISFIEFPEQRLYRDPFDESAAVPYQSAQALASDIQQLWQYLHDAGDAAEFVVVLSDHQKEWFRKHFGDTYEDVLEDWDRATTLRAGIMTIRLVTILTTLRYWFDRRCLDRRMAASNADFDLAMKLGEYFRRNTNSFIDRFEVVKREVLPAQEKRKATWFSNLPPEFDAKTAVRIGEFMGIARSTVFRILRKDRRIHCIGRSRYRKVQEQS